jgi:hypothetical protein
MPSIKITKTQLPDHVGDVLDVLSNDGQKIGILRFTAKSGTTTSTLELAPGQLPHRTYPLRSKHRAR